MIVMIVDEAIREGFNSLKDQSEYQPLYVAELAEQQIYQNTIRLSIGTEHIDDILADLEAGFAAVRGK